ncbi:MAG: hypothetical protein WAU07_05505 [Microgenomates group bacterium]
MFEIIKKTDRTFELPKNTPADQIIEHDSHLEGVGHYYAIENGKLTLKEIPFKVHVNSEKLPPFNYRKPIVESDVFNPNEDTFESPQSQRANYIPLAIIWSGFRGPHHWHRPDNAVLCAVKINDIWETRYFTQQNIPVTTWMAVKRIMSIEKTDNTNLPV